MICESVSDEIAELRASGRDVVIAYYRSRTPAYTASDHYPHSHEITITGDVGADVVAAAPDG